MTKLLPKNYLGDKIYSICIFLLIHQRYPKNRLLFNDVLHRMKVTGKLLDPLRVFITDKEFLKIYITAKIGSKYNVPTIKVLKNQIEVDSYIFPDNCCIKPTHASGIYIIRQNTSAINTKKIKSWFNLNFYKVGRELNYKNLKPKVIVEPLVFNSTNLNDYKFFCYLGKVKLIQVDVNREKLHCRAIFDLDWCLQSYTIQHKNPEFIINRPDNLDEMLEIAKKLSQDFSFVRIDLYSNGKQCHVGEITNCHGNAKEVFIPPEAELIASNIIFN